MTRVAMYSPVAIDRRVDVLAAISRVVERRRYILGDEVRLFEEAFARFCGVAHSVGVANGTDALEIALRALEVGPGDCVAMVANAGPYASSAARACGAVPLFVDIDPRTRTMSAASLAEAVPHRPKVVVVTHLYGQLADMATLGAIAAQAGMLIVEDCAQAHGAIRDGRRAGSFGVIGTFSFYPTKNLPAVGDGGALVTGDDQLAQRMRRLRQYGWSDKYVVEVRDGRNSRLDEAQAAVLLDRLPFVDEWNAERRLIARRYREGMAGMPADLPAVGSDYVAHLFAIEADDRAALRASLDGRGIETTVHFPIADHQQPAYAAHDHLVAGSLDHTERSCARVVSLPCYPGLSDDDVDEVLAALAAHWQVG